MDYRILGRTGLRVSVIGMGSWQLSGPLDVNGQADGFPDIGRDAVIQLIQACGDLGINFIDSAEIYGDGEGEQRIGEAVKGKRDRWIVSTKFGLRRTEAGNRLEDASPVVIRSSLERSLRRLQSDYVDLYLYHSPPDACSILEGKRVLDALKQEGKIRFYGISTDDRQVLNQMVSCDAVEVAMFAQSLIVHPTNMLDLVKIHNLGRVVRGSLAAGQLSGKYFHQTPQISAQDFRSAVTMPWSKYAFYEKFLPPGVSMTAFALRYLLDFDTTHTIILGGKSLENYQEALKALALPALNPETHKTLRQVQQRLAQKEFAKKMLRPIGRPIKNWLRSVTALSK